MKTPNASTSRITKVHLIVLFAMLAIAATIVAWAVEPAAPAATTNAKTSVEKPPVPTLVTYQSRNYGVSFFYPPQYGFVNERTIAKSSADSSLRPKPDGRDQQITLARVDIPKGDYEGTDFESGYFTMSLDQEIHSQAECDASLGVLEGGKLENDAINGTQFHWIDIETEGSGQAKKMRQYVTFANNTCYEFEMGVTRNQDGLAPEVNPDTVMLRLDGILRTVEIQPDHRTVTLEAKTSTQDPKPASHN
jgi:hypothetical protein